MIAYKGKTYCPFTDCIKECNRKFTEAVKEACDDLDMMICLFTEKPSCYEES